MWKCFLIDFAKNLTEKVTNLWKLLQTCHNSQKETTKTQRIARARIHGECDIGKLKNFKILSGETLKYSIDQIIVVCAEICNLNSSVVSK